MKSLNKVSGSSYELLKNEIEETFGRKIYSSGDCILLSEEVYAKIYIKINFNTLRRFFGLVKSRFRPSSTTLNILSKYCSFSSFDEFLRLKGNLTLSYGNDNSESILKYLISLFENTTVKGPDDKTFYRIVEHTICFLQRHTELIDRFQRAVAKTKNGRDYYFEQFVNLDALPSIASYPRIVFIINPARSSGLLM